MNNVIVICAAIAGFLGGWLACETRVWRQIKKAHTEKAVDCPCCGFPHCGHEHPCQKQVHFEVGSLVTFSPSSGNARTEKPLRVSRVEYKEGLFFHELHSIDGMFTGRNLESWE